MPSFLWACCCNNPCNTFDLVHRTRTTPSGYVLAYGSGGGNTYSFSFEGDAWGSHEWERSLDRRKVGGVLRDCRVLFAWKSLLYAGGVLDAGHVGQSADYKVKSIRDGQLPTAGTFYGQFPSVLNTTGYFETSLGSGEPLDFEPYAWPNCDLGGYDLADTSFDPKADELDALMDDGPRTLGLSGRYTFLALFRLRSYKVRHTAAQPTGPIPEGAVLVSPEEGRKDLMVGKWFRG